MLLDLRSRADRAHRQMGPYLDKGPRPDNTRPQDLSRIVAAATHFTSYGLSSQETIGSEV